MRWINLTFTNICPLDHLPDLLNCVIKPKINNFMYALSFEMLDIGINLSKSL